MSKTHESKNRILKEQIVEDIKAKLDEPQIDYSDPEAVQERRMNGGQMELVRVPGRPVRILLRTLGKKDEEGCWMDTGILF